MRKGFSLIEILIVIAISSFFIIFLGMVFMSDNNIYDIMVYEQEVNDYLRNTERLMYKKVVNAEEVELLDSLPVTFDAGYTYVYSKNGNVYYREGSGDEINITEKAEEDFETVFTKQSENVLAIEINSTSNSSNNKKTDLKLRNESTTIQLQGINSSTNIIKFITNLPEVLEVEITRFDFEKSSNGNPTNWISNSYVGAIDQATSTITVEVDEEVNAGNLLATIEHNGDSITLNAGSNINMSYINPVTAVITRAGNSRTYTVIVVKKNVPQILEFGFRAIDNTHVVDSFGNQIPLAGIKTDPNKYASNDKDTGYREGAVEGAVGSDKMGYVHENTKEIFVSLDSVRGSNYPLVPYLKIKGEYVIIDGIKVMAGPPNASGESIVIFPTTHKIDFNPGRTFSNYEAAENPIGAFTGGTVVGTNNEFKLLQPKKITVYENSGSGSIMRSREYEVYVSPYGYAGALYRVDEFNNQIFKAWIDEKNLKVYMPFEGNVFNDKFRFKFTGNAINIYRRSYDYRVLDNLLGIVWEDMVKEQKWYITDSNDYNDVSPYVFTHDFVTPASEYYISIRDSYNNATTFAYENTKNLTRIGVYNQDVYDKTDFPGKTDLEKRDDLYEMDKFYQIIYQSAGIFNFYYEDTEVQNKYLHEKIVRAEITQGHAETYSSVGNGSPSGEIALTFPQNEYLKELVATVSFMGSEFGNVNSAGQKILQQSEVTINDISNNNIIEYYVKSEINSDYYRYKFNVQESPSPEIVFNAGDSLVEKTVNGKTVLEAPAYNYGKGTNRDEYVETDTLENQYNQSKGFQKYTWYFVEDKNDIGDASKHKVIDGVTGKEFNIDDNINKLDKNGYVYAGIQTRSASYKVGNDWYGGVKTNTLYTDGYYQAVQIDTAINLDYVLFAEESIDLNNVTWKVPTGSGVPVAHSNGDLYIKVSSNYWGAPNRIGQAVGLAEIKTSGKWDSQSGLQAISGVSRESINFSSNIEQRILKEEVDNKDIVTIQYNWSGGSTGNYDILSGKDWIVANKVTFDVNSWINNAGGNANIKTNIKTKELDIKNLSNLELGSDSNPIIIYITEQDDLTINFDKINNFRGLIYAPNTNITLDGHITDGKDFKGAIYAKNIKSKGSITINTSTLDKIEVEK